MTPELIRRFDINGPRYTSYPTADRFVEAFGSAEYALALKQRQQGVFGANRPLSLYVHIPFCHSLCYYCACNKVITRHVDKADEYLHYLTQEVVLQTAVCGRAQKVSQLHLGGGTPTFFSDAALQSLMDMLRAHFQLIPGGEYSIEVDPRTVNQQRLAHLAQLGFNRISFGVQDFDPGVQQAVHRVQPAEQVFTLVDAARKEGFESVNVDLIYGLPRQTQASFQKTLQLVQEIRPDRIALYAYAHLPARFKPQRRIHTNELPSAATKIDILAQSFQDLTHAGYVYVGMDHFALATDSLAVAKKQGLLHRNFQGYSTQPDADLMGIGVSAIGRIGMTYSQNAKTLEQYYDLIRQGQLPVVRGLALSRDDCMRRAIIMALMCQGELDFAAIESAWLINFKAYFVSELDQLQVLHDQGLVKLTNSCAEVSETGWFFVRAIAMVFDRYLQADAQRQQFSRII